MIGCMLFKKTSTLIISKSNFLNSINPNRRHVQIQLNGGQGVILTLPAKSTIFWVEKSFICLNQRYFGGPTPGGGNNNTKLAF